MTDTEPLSNDANEGFLRTATTANPQRRLLLTSIAIAVVIVVIALLLLTVGGWGSVLNTATQSSSGNQIVPVEGGRPLDGAVSVWMSAGADLQDSLSAAGVTCSGTVDMGGGRFVLSVPCGAEVEAARLLREVEGVHDAGRVYAVGASAP